MYQTTPTPPSRRIAAFVLTSAGKFSVPFLMTLGRQWLAVQKLDQSLSKFPCLPRTSRSFPGRRRRRRRLITLPEDQESPAWAYTVIVGCAACVQSTLSSPLLVMSCVTSRTGHPSIQSCPDPVPLLIPPLSFSPLAFCLPVSPSRASLDCRRNDLSHTLWI